MSLFRKPTVEEAGKSILNAMTKEFRKSSLIFFEANYGKEYAEQVRQYVERHWRKK